MRGGDPEHILEAADVDLVEIARARAPDADERRAVADGGAAKAERSASPQPTAWLDSIVLFNHDGRPHSGRTPLTIPVRLRVNGTERQHDVEPRMLLVHLLRDVYGLTGTHVGCETSICGACTVLVDGRAVKSC